MPPFFDQYGDPTMDPYTILSLPPTSTEAEIKKAYRMQMLQLHPDKLSPSLTDASIAAVTDKFHNVKDAYEFLVSPLHLTARRLYTAKMASRRADFERREAYLRRNGGKGDDFTAYNARGGAGGGVNGYRSGGGGMAGMAGTGMPQHQSQHQPQHQPHHQHSQHQQPSRNGSRSKKIHRSKSEADVQGEGRDDYGQQQRGKDPHRGSGQRQRRSGGGNNNNNGGMFRHNNTSRGRNNSKFNQSLHNSTKRGMNYNKGRGDRGYKSDTAGYTKTKKSPNNTTTREGRSSKPRSKNNSTFARSSPHNNHRQRTRTEPPRQRRRDKSEGRVNWGSNSNNNKENRKSRNNDHNNRERDADRDKSRERRRRRARSAPARYSRNNNNSSRGRTTTNNNNGYTSGGNNSQSNSNLPKHFFCPLTKRLMKDPVMDNEGNAYEREAIERWLRVQSSSPVTNGSLTLDMLRPNRELKRAIYRATGKPRSKSQTRTKSRSTSPTEELNSNRVLIDSYLREISSKSKLSVSLDGTGICAFSYRRTTFVIEVPITPGAGFMVYSSFDSQYGESNTNNNKLGDKMEAWNTWLTNIGRHSRVSYVMAGRKTVFTLKGSEGDMKTCDVFQKTLEYFVTMSLKLHNFLHPMETKVVDNVCLTRVPVAVA